MGEKKNYIDPFKFSHPNPNIYLLHSKINILIHKYFNCQHGKKYIIWPPTPYQMFIHLALFETIRISEEIPNYCTVDKLIHTIPHIDQNIVRFLKLY